MSSATCESTCISTFVKLVLRSHQGKNTGTAVFTYHSQIHSMSVTRKATRVPVSKLKYKPAPPSSGAKSKRGRRSQPLGSFYPHPCPAAFCLSSLPSSSHHPSFHGPVHLGILSFRIRGIGTFGRPFPNVLQQGNTHCGWEAQML